MPSTTHSGFELPKIDVAPRTRILGAVPNVPDTFCTEIRNAGYQAGLYFNQQLGYDVGHAGKFHVIGDELVGCPGEEALVRLGHTRDHDCFHGLGIGFELYTDIGGDGYCPGLITHIGNL